MNFAFCLSAAFILLATAAKAEASPHDEYYSGDIFTAIEEARQRTHHYDYSRATRYNRSTSQSIPIPRLLNTEMARTIIETPDAVDIGPGTHNGTTNNGTTEPPETGTPELASSSRPPLSVSDSSPVSVKVTVR